MAIRLWNGKTIELGFLKLDCCSGSYGYRAPECDVYSFGVVALEIMMGRHPGELLESLSENRGLYLKDLLDQRLRSPSSQLAAGVVSIVTVALACMSTDPGS
ncbi:MDIS1-interacting receptor like kinase 2 [Rosa chinensis]|uniref:MDIS1-interacting receptor like kinase 2 n=1 Tax=Rosa chinensis TaxID=74649 RepID=UPI001AD8F460|nr:MDIS1-interacting receptor like kinase 2 [Rosa chinensis]